MSDDVRRLTTEEERERLYIARNRGGFCALCGRTLDEGEPVYWEHFVVGKGDGYRSYPQAPVGAECASPWLLEEKDQEEPEPCADCGRPTYYATGSTKRRRAACSQRCQMRASRAARLAPKAGD